MRKVSVEDVIEWIFGGFSVDFRWFFGGFVGG